MAIRSSVYSYAIPNTAFLSKKERVKIIDNKIAIIEKRENFKQIEETISKIQKTQSKKIHLIDMTEIEFKQELLNKNKAYLDALKKGIILFGQENLIKSITDLSKA
ncbi:MAG: hypothetical protein WCP89_02815 [archaeon]